MLTFDRALANPLRASVMYPPDRRLFRPFAVAARVADLLAAVGPRAGLYAHVPFCETKCTYCDYETVPLGKYAGAGVEAYVQALCTELRTTLAALPRATTITGFDIGGGTPGAMSAEQFLRVIDTLGAARRAAGFEISTETTPTLAAADPPKWAAIRRAGVSRVSMGVQTDDEALLGRMNRAQDKSDRMRRGIDALRDAGFAIVNLDLMFALPGLTAERFIESVDFAIALAPDVITIYDTVYKNRGIATQARRWDLTPAPKDYGDQYDRAFLRLNAAGYRGRYGSVNFSRVPGRLGTSRYLESRILDGADYVGVGLYASSLAGNVWRFGKKSYGAWIERAARGDLAAEDV